MNENQIAERITGRKVAEEVIELGGVCREGLASDAALAAFWERIARWVEPHIPAKDPDRRPLEPMSYQAAEWFGETRMPWGKYVGQPVAEVPLEYLCWLIDQPDEFKDELRRYVKSKSVQRELEGTET